MDNGNILYNDCSNLLNRIYKISYFLNYFIFNRIFKISRIEYSYTNFIQYEV